MDLILRIVNMLLRFFYRLVARCAVVTLGMWLYLRHTYVLLVSKILIIHLIQ